MRAFWLVFAPAAVYQVLAIFAGLRHLSRRKANRNAGQSSFKPAVSVLKPLRGLDPAIYDAFLSQAAQNYPKLELLFGVADPQDPAVSQVQRLQQQFPQLSIRLIVVGNTAALNGKVGTLLKLAEHARYPVWVINDSDIKVTPEYLSEIVSPLADPSVGVVTCLYRACAHSIAGTWESLGIATDFMPSTLVAQLLGVREFGLGSTLAFRADDLRRAGGFGPIAEYIADDYQLAKLLSVDGKRALLSTYTVETFLGDTTWSGVWNHQLRWARTIRASKGAGYAGLPFTHAGIWIVIALATGAWMPAATLLLLRIASALVAGTFVLRSAVALRLIWLSPLWDLYSFAVWFTSYAGRQVRWRGKLLKLDRQGRIRQ